MSRPGPVDVAIVGAGPKGFGCLERLATEVRRCTDPPRLRVSLHDPANHPGAGPIYDPGQPPYLLMNFAARHVDVWSRDTDEPGSHRGRDSGGRGEDRPDLVTWLGKHHPAWADPDAFVPRRLVGSYLRAAFESLLGSLPEQLTVDSVPGVVTDVQRAGDRWWIRHDDPALDRAVDEVVLTVGHGTWAPGHSCSGAVGGLPTIAPPYPVTRLDVDRIPPGSTVAVRGFALTFIDVALALTLGRGGVFEGIGADDPAAARYRVSGAEVARIVPFSRTGLPLLAKPGPELVARAGELHDVWDRLRGRIRASAGTSLRPALCDALAASARAALHRVRGSLPDTEQRAIATLLGPDRALPTHGSGVHALAAMRRSVEVAGGHRAPDAAWALGEAWRQGYPALVQRVGHGGVATRERPDVVGLAARMERLAFGAPAENLHRLVVLTDAGLIDLGQLRAPHLVADRDGSSLASEGGRTPVDVLVDAVIEPPGIGVDSPLWGQLLRRGQVRVGSGTRGAQIATDASCVDRAGRRVPGLAAVGRATEGWVLGNDTLSRTLHAETRRWARRVAGQRREELTDRAERTVVGRA